MVTARKVVALRHVLVVFERGVINLVSTLFQFGFEGVKPFEPFGLIIFVLGGTIGVVVAIEWLRFRSIIPLRIVIANTHFATDDDDGHRNPMLAGRIFVARVEHITQLYHRNVLRNCFYVLRI